MSSKLSIKKTNFLNFRVCCLACRMCKGAVAGLSILMAMTWSMSKGYSNALDYPTTYLTNALLPVCVCILSSYFVAELWGQVVHMADAVIAFA